MYGLQNTCYLLKKGRSNSLSYVIKLHAENNTWEVISYSLNELFSQSCTLKFSDLLSTEDSNLVRRPFIF